MLDYAKLIHEAIGIDSPRMFITVFALVGLVLFGGIGWLIDKGYRVKLREPAIKASDSNSGSLRAPVAPKAQTPLAHGLVFVPPVSVQPAVRPQATKQPPTSNAPSSVAQEKNVDKPNEKSPSIQQRAAGPNSPNIVTLGPNSPVTINPIAKPWGLDTTQLELLMRRMSKYAPVGDRADLITCVLGDPESTRFAAGLVGAFRSAGWTLSGSGFNQAIYSGPVVGVIIKLKSSDSRPPGFLDFVSTLRESGIEPTGEIDDKIPPSDFQLVIGSKPPS